MAVGARWLAPRRAKSIGPVTIEGKRGWHTAGMGARGDAMTYCSERLIVLGEHSRLIMADVLEAIAAEICSPLHSDIAYGIILESARQLVRLK